ncbi:glycosyltransferase family 2 protein [uncultured Pseudodesulfovibrio sp.]|uniref:glycosyltransferase family 2 protein n=1 Tax=uncultured Pseudodesulfovibrio sp. TaxID=2035858 RepID=UPI0029C7C23B|nr:glycosyltransferase family 2 protein [uncultured Pseudodesulfovibrio sp.]
MLNGKKVVLVMPAYNAGKTLRKTYDEIPKSYVDEVILVDDKSDDNTAELADSMGIRTFIHSKNRGYGGNQKTCYAKALECGADIVVMLHPDYQYTPKLVPAMVTPIAEEIHDCMLGSRILGKGARIGGMPFYKYMCNRVLTLVQNLLIQEKLSEYHTGYRAFSREILETLPLEQNSDDFIFDNQMLCQAIYAGFKIGEVTCPTRYEKESSSISFLRSCKYGLGVLKCSLETLLHRLDIRKSPMLAPLDDES